jgi:hypothetical protein
VAVEYYVVGLLAMGDFSNFRYVVLCILFFVCYDVFLVVFSIVFGDVMVGIRLVILFL